jgi:acyl-coenzyme A synthetase/AMP-(fatty) acid ligase
MPDDRTCILRTSGTTGSAKRILNSRSTYDAKIMRWIAPIGLNRRSRLLVTMSLAVQGMYSCASACPRAGGTVIAAHMPKPRDIAPAILEHGITMLILAPIQIKRVLDAMPDGFAKPPSLTLCSFGAAVSPALRERALSTLATEIIDMYGTNETGFISSIDSGHDNGISTIWPGVRVEIVDEHDAPLPHGQMGRTRAQTPEMVQDYLDDPEASQRMFKDGWFYPGDIGVLHGARGLQILGRGDALLNFGGRKIAPEALERAILKAVPLRDVAVCSMPNPEGLEELLIALVDPQGDDRELLERLSDALKRFPVGKFGAARLPEIPRNANGKIRRDLLRSAVMDVLRCSRIVTL